MSNRKSKIAEKFPRGKWDEREINFDYERFLSKKYTGPLPRTFLLLLIRRIVEGKIEYSTVNTDEKLSNFIFHILRNTDYAKKFGFDGKPVDEVRSTFPNLGIGGKMHSIKNVSFSLDLNK
jgi:hypothetical protein